jgi:hypothetical protein
MKSLKWKKNWRKVFDGKYNKNPSSILPYYRGEGFFYENIQFIKTDVFPLS